MARPRPDGRRDVIRGLFRANPPLTWLCLSTLFVFMAKSMLDPLASLYATALGGTPAVVGAVVASAFVIPAMVAIPIGRVVDRLGAPRMMVVGTWALIASALLVVAVPGLAMLFVARVVNGLAHVILMVATQVHVAAVVPPHRREEAISWYSTFVSAGQLLGPLVIGVLVDVAGFAAAFGAGGAAAALALAPARRLQGGGRRSGVRDGAPAGPGPGAAGPAPIPTPADGPAPAARVPGRPRPSGSAPGGPAGVRELLRNDGVKLAIAVSSGILFAMGARQAFLPVYLYNLDFSTTAIGFVLSFRSVVSMVIRPLIPGIIALLGGRRPALMAATLMTAAGLGLTGFARDLISIGLLTVLIGVGIGASQPLTIVAVADHVEEGRQGLALGLRMAANRTAQLINPVIFGLVAEAAGFGVTFLTGGLLLGLVSAMVAKWGAVLDGRQPTARTAAGAAREE